MLVGFAGPERKNQDGSSLPPGRESSSFKKEPSCQSGYGPDELLAHLSGRSSYDLFLIGWEIFIRRSNPLITTLAFAGGLAAWTLLEYGFHRWVYHKGQTPAHEGHKIHHDQPTTLIAMPWFVVTGLFGSIWYVFGHLLQIRFVSTFAAGLLSGFVFYGLFHHLHHHLDFQRRWCRRLRAHHIIHHKYTDVNFGVTSRFWDHVFGTTYKKAAGNKYKRIAST